MSRLVWVSRAGAEQPMNAVIRGYASPRISPDGSRVVVQAGNLWLQDLARSTFTRLAASSRGASTAEPMPALRRWRWNTGAEASFRTVRSNSKMAATRRSSLYIRVRLPAQMTADGATLVFLERAGDVVRHHDDAARQSAPDSRAWNVRV
jgi:hypothetical protein